MRRYWAIFATVVAVGLGLAACGSSSSGSSGGTPTSGGTLYMLGTGDVDYMDPNISYYTTGYLGLRMWARQLLTYPAIQGQTTTVVPDLATQVPTTSNGGISADGLTYKLTIRTGAMWNTSPPRQVTAADEVLGVKRLCNPHQPFGGLPDFETLIAGLQAYCNGFSKVAPTVAGIKGYIMSNSISGVQVDPSNPQTVVFTLTHPATYFIDQLAMPAFSPAPIEFLNYLPASAQLAQHTISDGPYEIASYSPSKTLDFVRNPAWQASSDPVRKAYVNAIDVSMTGNQNAIFQQLQANSSTADMGWDNHVPTVDIPALLSSKDPNFNLGATYGTSPYVVFNAVSPNNGGALGNIAVRQALSYAINRSHLIQDYGGPQVSPPLTHILPSGIVGSQQFDNYPYDPSKAKTMLQSAGVTHLTLKLLYQNALDFETKMFQTLQSDLSQIGVTVEGVSSPSANFYTGYLQVPSVAHRGVWDLALTQWFPDWYGNAALSFFGPLFSGSAAFPPIGSNFGFYNNPKVTSLTQQASTAKTESDAATLWAQADQQVMADAAIFPITSPNSPDYHASRVHGAVFVPNLYQFDPTNVWLSPQS